AGDTARVAASRGPHDAISGMRTNRRQPVMQKSRPDFSPSGRTPGAGHSRRALLFDDQWPRTRPLSEKRRGKTLLPEPCADKSDIRGNSICLKETVRRPIRPVWV